MGHQIEMGEFYAIDYFFEKMFDLLLLQLIVLEVLAQFPLAGHLHDHEDVSSGVEHLIQLDDVGVVEELQDADLPFDLTHA